MLLRSSAMASSGFLLVIGVDWRPGQRRLESGQPYKLVRGFYGRESAGAERRLKCGLGRPLPPVVEDYSTIQRRPGGLVEAGLVSHFEAAFQPGACVLSTAACTQPNASRLCTSSRNLQDHCRYNSKRKKLLATLKQRGKTPQCAGCASSYSSQQHKNAHTPLEAQPSPRSRSRRRCSRRRGPRPSRSRPTPTRRCRARCCR